MRKVSADSLRPSVRASLARVGMHGTELPYDTSVHAIEVESKHKLYLTLLQCGSVPNHR